MSRFFFQESKLYWDQKWLVLQKKKIKRKKIFANKKFLFKQFSRRDELFSRLDFSDKDEDLDGLECNKDEDDIMLLAFLKSSTYDFSIRLEYLLYLGHLIIGLGSVVIYSVGISYIEEITPADRSSYCQAIFYGVGSIGGGIGFLVTGQFLNINARFYSSSYEPNNWITIEHPYWIGAW